MFNEMQGSLNRFMLNRVLFTLNEFLKFEEDVKKSLLIRMISHLVTVNCLFYWNRNSIET